MPPKKKAGDDDVSFEISGSAPASQTSIVVDDAWPSQKNRSRELKWTKKPKSTPDKIKVEIVSTFFLSLSFQPLPLFTHAHSLNQMNQNANAGQSPRRLHRVRRREAGVRDGEVAPGAAEKEEEGRGRSRRLIFFLLFRLVFCFCFVFLESQKNYSSLSS